MRPSDYADPRCAMTCLTFLVRDSDAMQGENGPKEPIVIKMVERGIGHVS